MKRWTTILGRSGTTLIAISLALVLVSIVPQPQFSRTEGSMPFSSGHVRIISNPQGLTPQQEVQVTVTAEGTIKIYLLEITLELEFTTTGFTYRFNLTDLQKLLEEHPDQIIWEREVEDGEYTRSYTPTRVTNATVVIYNPSSETAYVEYMVALKSSLAPADKVRNIAYGTTPIGIILAIPWLLNIWKQRKQK